MSQLQDYFLYQIIDAHKLIYTKFLEPVGHEQYKTAMLEVYKEIEEKGLRSWVMDSTRRSFTLEDQKWSVEQLGLLLHGTDLKKVAMVRNHDVFLQVVAEGMRNKIYRTFGKNKELQHFATLKEALYFLVPGADYEKLENQLKGVGI